MALKYRRCNHFRVAFSFTDEVDYQIIVLSWFSQCSTPPFFKAASLLILQDLYWKKLPP